MSRVYDYCKKLVGSVLRREEDRQLAYCESFNSGCSSDLGSSFSLDRRLRDAASTGGDVENQKASDPPPDKGKQTAPPSSEEEPPTSQKESSEDQDKDKRKKSSDQGVIKMLQGMKATSEEEKSLEDSMEPVKGRPVAKTTKPRRRDSNRSANAQLQQAKPKRPSVNMASAAQKKMVKPLVNDLTKSGVDKSESQKAVPDDGGDGGAADIEDEQSLQQEEVQALGGIIDPLEGLMDPLRLLNWNEVTFGSLQQFMKNNKGRRRQTDTAKSIYVASDFMEQLSDIDDDDSSSSVTEPILSMSSNKRYGSVIHDWQKGELLGRGAFGSVYAGIADGGFFFSVKEVSLLDQGVEGKQCIIQLEQEIALLSQFKHDNIVRYYGTEKDATHLYIFLELVTQGSLLRLYQKYDLRVPQVSGYTRQILHGLKYLHDRNVIHRDIKCANILVHTNGLVKLADFGLAKMAAKLNDVKSCKGTAFWMAPEVVRSKGYGLAADIWSLGCTVLEMLIRSFPYSGLEYMTALYKIGQGERPFVPNTLSSDAQDFILQCLQVDPSLRPTAAQLLDHPFVKRPLPSSSGVASAHSFGWQF